MSGFSMVIDAEKLACDALDFKIYPNPSDGIFNLTFQSCVDEAYIEIFDIIGKKITELNTSTVNNQLQLTQVADGQYVLRITMNGRSLSKLISVMK